MSLGMILRLYTPSPHFPRRTTTLPRYHYEYCNTQLLVFQYLGSSCTPTFLHSAHQSPAPVAITQRHMTRSALWQKGNIQKGPGSIPLKEHVVVVCSFSRLLLGILCVCLSVYLPFLVFFNFLLDCPFVPFLEFLPIFVGPSHRPSCIALKLHPSPYPHHHHHHHHQSPSIDCVRTR